MRQLYKYKVIQYFPHVKSDEFFNVGIYLYTKEEKELYMLTNEHLELINDCSLIKKDILEDYIVRLKNEKNIDSWYGNYLRLSKEKRRRNSMNFKDMKSTLYNDQVGYKFSNKDETKELLEKRVEELEKQHVEKDIIIQSLSMYSFATTSILNTIKRSHR